MVRNQAYSSFADFEREEIRPGMRIGWSVDELEDASGEDFDFDSDLFEEAVWDAEEEDEDQDLDED
jgi:hypothetical protein